MISEGVDVKNVQASLGHSPASTTLNIYAHVFSKVNATAGQAGILAKEKSQKWLS